MGINVLATRVSYMLEMGMTKSKVKESKRRDPSFSVREDVLVRFIVCEEMFEPMHFWPCRSYGISSCLRCPRLSYVPRKSKMQVTYKGRSSMFVVR